MDARTFQQHAARVAELTDTLLAERAADKADSALGAKSAGALGAKTDSTSRQSDSGAAALFDFATPRTASPGGRCSTSPGKSHGPAAPAGGTQKLFTPGKAGTRRDSEAAPDSREHDESCPPAVPTDRAAAASSSDAGQATSFSPSGDAAGVLCGPYYCTVCNVSTTSAVHLQTHYMGSKHQRRLAQSQDNRDHSPHYCPICAISATSAVHLQLHLNGRAHQRKAKLAAQAEAGGSQYTTAGLAESNNTGGLLLFSWSWGGGQRRGGRGRVGGGMGCAASIGAAALTVDTLRESSHHTPLLPSLIAMHQVRCHNFFRGECRKHHSHNGLAKSSQPLEMLHSLLARCSYACPDPAAALNAALHAVLMPVYIVICSSGICTVHACLLTVAHNQTLLEGLRGWIHVCFGKPRRATHGIMWQRGCRQTVTGAGSCCGAGYRESGDHTAGGQESRPGSGKQDNCRDSSAQSSSVGGRQQAGRQGPATTQAHSARSDGHLQDTDRHPEAYM